MSQMGVTDVGCRRQARRNGDATAFDMSNPSLQAASGAVKKAGL
jgi:hypothetical protein